MTPDLCTSAFNQLCDHWSALIVFVMNHFTWTEFFKTPVDVQCHKQCHHLQLRGIPDTHITSEYQNTHIHFKRTYACSESMKSTKPTSLMCVTSSKGDMVHVQNKRPPTGEFFTHMVCTYITCATTVSVLNWEYTLINKRTANHQCMRPRSLFESPHHESPQHQ